MGITLQFTFLPLMKMWWSKHEQICDAKTPLFRGWSSEHFPLRKLFNKSWKGLCDPEGCKITKKKLLIDLLMFWPQLATKYHSALSCFSLYWSVRSDGVIFGSFKGHYTYCPCSLQSQTNDHVLEQQNRNKQTALGKRSVSGHGNQETLVLYL